MSNEGEGGVSMTLTIRAVSLKVLDSDRDAGRGVIRLDSGTMESLGASAGDILEVLGGRRTVARCLPSGHERTDAEVAVEVPSHQADVGVARIDRIMRENARVSVGDTITLRKAYALPANYAEVTPLAELQLVDSRYIELALNGVPVVPGDVVMVPEAEPSGKERYFQVIGLEPQSEQAVLKVSTIFNIVRRSTKETATI
jgi:transitional endoplasmic reticulum ATPase